ncbi:hypothetical protein [Bacillus sp. JCM 19041]
MIEPSACMAPMVDFIKEKDECWGTRLLKHHIDYRYVVNGNWPLNIND